MQADTHLADTLGFISLYDGKAVYFKQSSPRLLKPRGFVLSEAITGAAALFKSAAALFDHV